ncbi:MAG TPA: GNAT family N-acetyltransferase [Gemmatimonadota bacterium]|nr:GNAT family N-acetyltransferase [Gemmatimonadota bacterium]
MFPEPIETYRLSLRAMTAEAMDAWILGDAAELERMLGVRFAGDAVDPPLDLDDLVHVHDRLGEASVDGGFWAWMVVLRRTREPIGLVTLAGGDSDPDGGAVISFSVYPCQKGYDYTEEAVEGLMAWTLSQPGVRYVRAAVRVGNDSSMRVAESAGMHPTGTSWDPDDGQIVVFERSARRSNSGD